MKFALRNRTLLSYALAHFSVDLCAGALPVIMLFIAPMLDLSIAQAGFVIGVYAISSSLTQPLFGYISDRTGGRYQSAIGLAMIAIFQGLLGFATSYGMLLAMVTLAGCGSAAFHPHGASGATRAGGDRKASFMAVFMLGGNTGYALGPVIAAAAMSAFGVHGSAVICLIGLALVPVVLTAQGSPAAHQVTRSNAVAGSIRTFSVLAVIALMAIMFLRAWTQSSITTYVPVFFTQVAGFSVQEASRISSVNLFALAAGGLVGGMLSDRFGGRRVMIISWLIYAPAVLLLFGAPDARVYLIAAVAGFVAGASWPPLIVMAQELFPKNAGVASGIALGFAFAMGGIGTTITGWLAEPEHLGLTSALLMLSVLPVISALLAFLLPRDAHRQPIAQHEPATATVKS
jgi:FSR family fosmidomycin resistance protein-like MFS transporter